MIGCIKSGNQKFRTKFYSQLCKQTRIPSRVRCSAKELWVEFSTPEVAETAKILGISTLLSHEEQFGSIDIQVGGTTNMFQILQEGEMQNYLGSEMKGLSGCLPITTQDKTQLVGVYLFEFSEDKAQAILSIPQKSLFVVLKLQDWKIIPVENAIAQLSDVGENRRPVPIYPVVSSVEEASLMLNILEIGSNGVVLQTQDPSQVEEMWQFMKQQQQKKKGIKFNTATISKITEVDLCDRVCVDVCSMMTPGQGMLVGCFSRGLFLVHSECEETGYINSRPFRVNAGAVSCYVQCPKGRTQYLSELQCGSEVAIFDFDGNESKAIVGRSKIEQRPMIIIEAIVDDNSAGGGSEGDSISVILQNAETVKLVGPVNGGWRTIPVTEMQQGDKVFVQCMSGARHTGIIVQESIVEK